jgi:TusA-related sulfurtransferase
MSTRRTDLLTSGADYTVDVRGAITPFSLLKVSLVFQQMKPSETLEILGCDAEMQRDLMRLLPNASCETADNRIDHAAADTHRVRLQKKPVNR